MWNATLSRSLVGLRHFWTKDRKTLVGAEYQVMAVFVAGDGTSSGREVRVWFTPQEAREYAEVLLKLANETEAKNNRI
jgi:hypothetical protein